MKTLLLSLLTAGAMFGSSIWNYTGGSFVVCAAGECPAYTQNDSLDATFVFSEEIPAEGTGTTSVADVTSWSISDSLDHFSFSSQDQNASGELEYAKLSQTNGDILHYMVSALTAPCGIVDCQKGENSLGLLGSMDEIVFDFGNQDSWTAVFDSGSWVDPPFAAATAAAPEPGTAWLLLLTVVIVAGFVVLYRSEPKR